MLALLCTQQGAAASHVEGILVSTHPIDWEFADGHATETFLVMDDGREYRFAHARVTDLRSGERCAWGLPRARRASAVWP
ncbi:MAG TPA: hypothetical protein VLN90_06365 [Thioalkalivibrio sp.]|nr:hypothetical protein [Thioalkalivibrio sp.]